MKTWCLDVSMPIIGNMCNWSNPIPRSTCIWDSTTYIGYYFDDAYLFLFLSSYSQLNLNMYSSRI